VSRRCVDRTSFRKTLFGGLGVFLVPALLSVSWAENRVGGAFLKMDIGARSSAMGSAFTAVADDADSVRWNPAGLARSCRQLSAMHSEGTADLSYDLLGFILPTSRGAIGVTAIALSQGDLERRDQSGRRDGSFDADDRALIVSLGQPLSPSVSVGLSGKYIVQQIDDVNAVGTAVDAGLQIHSPDSAVSWGLAVRNVGSDMRYLREEYHLPLNGSLGFGYQLLRSLTLTGDVSYEPYAHKTSAGLGTEYWAFQRVALRAGYLTSAARGKGSLEGSSLAEVPGVSFGVGLRLFGSQFDYAVQSESEWGPVHRLSFSFRF